MSYFICVNVGTRYPIRLQQFNNLAIPSIPTQKNIYTYSNIKSKANIIQMFNFLTVSKKNNSSSNTQNKQSKNILSRMVDQDLVLQVNLVVDS